MKFRNLFPLSVLFCCVIASAQAVYQYTGQNFKEAIPLDSTSGNLNISLNFPAALPVNSTITTPPTSWTLADGVTFFTSSNSGISVVLVTDGSGNIANWEIVASRTVGSTTDYMFSCSGIKACGGDIGDVSEHYFFLMGTTDPELTGYGFTPMLGTWTTSITAPTTPLATELISGSGYGFAAPGGAATIFGNFPGATTTVSGPRLPFSSGGLSVTVNNIPAALYYVSSNQINLQIPWELASGVTGIVVRITNGTWTATMTTEIQQIAPAVFEISPQHQGAILDQNYQVVSATNPAVRGSAIQVYCTGLGPVSVQQSDGTPASSTTLAKTTSTPQVLIAGIPATVLFSGLTPGSVGLYQINVVVPNSAPVSNTNQLTVSLNGVVANTVTVATND